MKRIFISMIGIITCMNLMAQTPVSFYDSLPSEGFGPIDESASTANLLEFNSHDKEGKTIDISKRNKHVRQLDAIKDAETIGKYSNASCFLYW